MTVKTRSFDVVEEGTEEEFIHALNTAARTKGMTKIARQAGVTRASLYKSLAPGGRPRFDTIVKVIKALGCTLAVVEFSQRRNPCPARQSGAGEDDAPHSSPSEKQPGAGKAGGASA